LLEFACPHKLKYRFLLPAPDITPQLFKGPVEDVEEPPRLF
jgi:hypothetical protein